MVLALDQNSQNFHNFEDLMWLDTHKCCILYQQLMIIVSMKEYQSWIEILQLTIY